MADSAIDSARAVRLPAPMEREHDRDKQQDAQSEEMHVPTAIETGEAPRPSQAEGDRQTVEEDLQERPRRGSVDT
jgi:hypothetical protein